MATTKRKPSAPCGNVSTVGNLPSPNAPAPVITLRNVKYAQFASQETACFEGVVYVDGRPLAHVHNDGHGGCNFYDRVKGGPEDVDAERLRIGRLINPQLVERYEGKQALVELKSFEEFEADYEGKYWERGVRYLEEFWDGLVGDLLTQSLVERDLRRWYKREVLFLKPGTAGVHTIKHRGREADATKHIRDKYPGATILNGLPMVEAVALFREHGK